jgi:Ser/Thr protein kinase RdoA (MazF antagonist)
VGIVWSPEITAQIVEKFLDQNGLAGTDVELVRFHQNAVYRLPTHNLTVRIYGPEDGAAKARLMVAFANFLKNKDLPAVRLAKHVSEQPFDIDGQQVTIWDWLDSDDTADGGYRAFGAALRELHAVSSSFEYPVADLDPMKKIRNRLDRLTSSRRLQQHNLDILESSYARALDLAQGLSRSRLGTGVLHGDALRKNAVQSGGKMHLIDFDSVCRGSLEWDLAPTLVAEKRLGLSEKECDAFLAGYGIDRDALPDIEPAMIVKQLSMTVVLCLKAGESDAIDTEIGRRLQAWDAWDFDTQWHSPVLG